MLPNAPDNERWSPQSSTYDCLLQQKPNRGFEPRARRLQGARGANVRQDAVGEGVLCPALDRRCDALGVRPVTGPIVFL